MIGVLATLLMGLPAFGLGLGVCHFATDGTTSEILHGEACSLPVPYFLALQILYGLLVQLPVCALNFWACLNAETFDLDSMDGYLKTESDIEKPFDKLDEALITPAVGDDR